VKPGHDRILTTHTGSLPRPTELINLFVRRRQGEVIAEAELARAGARALRSVVAKQKAAQIDVANNGEQNRDGFFRYVRHRIAGFGGVWSRPLKADIERFPALKRLRDAQNADRAGAVDRTQSPAADAPLRYIDARIIWDECAELSAAVREAGNPFSDVFMNAPSPGIVATGMGNLYYDTQEAYVAAIGAALKVEYEAIVNHGFVLQIDAPDLALEAGVAFQDRPRTEFISFIEMVVGTINRALENVPRERVRMHVCWGNSDSPHDRDIPLVEIMPIIKRAKVAGYVFPFASPAHAHEFRVFEQLPLADDQYIVAGVIDTVTNVIEHPEVIADRLTRVAAVVGDPRRVMAGTDCGFETIPGLSPVAEDVAWAKLTALAEGARVASRALFAG
jgi:5-methyltetrahydropteroyltriglutamate--homocysteine methyltransferase